MMGIDVENACNGQTFNLSMNADTIIFEFSGAYHSRDAMDEKLLSVDRLEASVSVL